MDGASKGKSFWAKVRDWHLWLGVAAALFIVTTSLTGIYLNHEDVFGEALGIESNARKDAAPAAAAPSLGTSDDPAAVGAEFARALAVAHERLGPDVPLRKLELNLEHGRREFRIHTVEGATGKRELFWDATTGAVVERGRTGYERTTTRADGTATSSTDWGKVIHDVHTGKIVAALGGHFWIDATAVILVTLTLSGVYLWLVARSRRRAAQSRSVTPAAVVSPPGVPRPPTPRPAPAGAAGRVPAG